jgi:hypothetical protein
MKTIARIKGIALVLLLIFLALVLLPFAPLERRRRDILAQTRVSAIVCSRRILLALLSILFLLAVWITANKILHAHEPPPWPRGSIEATPKSFPLKGERSAARFVGLVSVQRPGGPRSKLGGKGAD